MALNLGGIIRLTYTVKNDAVPPALTNPGTATLAITQPDGTLAAGITVTLPPVSTGLLVYDFTPTQFGLHQARWTTTGPTTSEPEAFVAEEPGRLLVSVDEAVSHLRAQGTITSDADREQLQWLCLVVSEAVEDDLGRAIMRRTVVDEKHTGGGSAIVLRKSPAISITSVTEGGVTVAGSAYLLDSPILYRGTTSGLSWWASGVLNIVVTYVAGFANPPKSTRMVALTALQSLWQASQQASHIALDESAEFAVSSAVAGLPDPLRSAYEGLRAVGIA